MDFSLSEERRMLVESLRRMLRDNYTIANRHRLAHSAPGHDSRIWTQLAELGVVGALVPPERGGYGGAPFDVMAVFETLGADLVSEPVLPVLMASRVLDVAKSSLLAEVVEGRTIAAFAHQEPHSRYALDDVRTTALDQVGSWKIDGRKAVVIGGEAADFLVVSAMTHDGLALFLVPADAPGVALRGYPTIDGLRAAEVSLDATIVKSDALLIEPGRAGPVIADAVDFGVLAVSAEALGIMETLKTMTLDYLRTRVQFGQPIGRNQALQHRMVEMMSNVEQVRSAVINAAAAMAGDIRARNRAIAAAKYTVGTAGARVAEEAIQLHGGIGMTEELPLSHFAKRLIMIDHQLGDADHHLERYVASSYA